MQVAHFHEAADSLRLCSQQRVNHIDSALASVTSSYAGFANDIIQLYGDSPVAVGRMLAMQTSTLIASEMWLAIP